MVENMINEKQHTTIYTFIRNRSDQFSSRMLSPEVDRTRADLILIRVTKLEETSVNKCHGHILLIIFIIYLLFIFDLHIF